MKLVYAFDSKAATSVFPFLLCEDDGRVIAGFVNEPDLLTFAAVARKAAALPDLVALCPSVAR